ncbi:nicotinate phosphoribosyltransferase, partial [Pseudomonas aeruginosa]
ISEVRNRARYAAATVEPARERLQETFGWLRRKASGEQLAGFKIADFGTRRRFPYRVHEAVVSGLTEDFPGCFGGTSNVLLA